MVVRTLCSCLVGSTSSMKCSTCNGSGVVTVINYEEAVTLDALGKMLGRKVLPVRTQETCPSCGGSGKV